MKGRYGSTAPLREPIFFRMKAGTAVVLKLNCIEDESAERVKQAAKPLTLWWSSLTPSRIQSIQESGEVFPPDAL